MKAVIMAGGEGTRLRPLTSQRPKPLTPALNMPIMEHIVLLLRQYGINDIVVTLHYLADEIENYFGDGSEWGVNIVYSVEETPLGTAGSVKQAEEFLKDDAFLIISGDALTDINLDTAVKFHRDKQSLATIVLSHVPNPLEFRRCYYRRQRPHPPLSRKALVGRSLLRYRQHRHVYSRAFHF